MESKYLNTECDGIEGKIEIAFPRRQSWLTFHRACDSRIEIARSPGNNIASQLAGKRSNGRRKVTSCFLSLPASA